MSFQANDHIQAPAQPAVQTSKDCLKDFSNSVFDRVLPDGSAPTYPSEQHTRIISEGLAAAPIFKKSLKTAQTQLDLTQQKIVKHDKKKLDRAIRAQDKANDLDRVWGSRDAWLPKDLIPADSRRFTTEQQPRLPVNDRIIEELMTITNLAVDNQIPLPSPWANNGVLTRGCKKRGETGRLTRTAAESAVKMLKEELEARRANRNETVEDDFGERDLSVPPEVGRGRDAGLSDNDALAVSRLDSPATNGLTPPPFPDIPDFESDEPGDKVAPAAPAAPADKVTNALAQLNGDEWLDDGTMDLVSKMFEQDAHTDCVILSSLYLQLDSPLAILHAPQVPHSLADRPDRPVVEAVLPLHHQYFGEHWTLLQVKIRSDMVQFYFLAHWTIVSGLPESSVNSRNDQTNYNAFALIMMRCILRGEPTLTNLPGKVARQSLVRLLTEGSAAKPEVVAAKVPAATSTEATGPSPSPSPRPQKRARDTTEDAGDDDDTAKLRATKRSITRLVAEVKVPPETAQELEKRLAQAQDVLAEARTEKSKAETELKFFDNVRKEHEDIREGVAAILDSKKDKKLPDQVKGFLHKEIVPPLYIYRRAIEEDNRFHTKVVRDLDKRLEESASKVPPPGSPGPEVGEATQAGENAQQNPRDPP
ncbi:hypothetical protein V8F06_007872 [Rhypophila decipiens]